MSDGREPLRQLAIVFASAILVAQLVRPDFGPEPKADRKPIRDAVAVPEEVDALLRRSCYDCHSNSTVVPWYGKVQPVAGWLAGHVRDGKSELNFEEFGSYHPRRQYRKLEEIAGEVRSDAMPLPSYLYVHWTSRLSDAERTQLYDWVESAREEMRQRYPLDSLQRRR